MSDLVFRTTRTDRPLFEALVETAKPWLEPYRDRGSHLWRGLLSQIANRRPCRCLQAAVFIRGDEAVGIMLPNTNGAAVAIFALVSAGRLPAMINFTAGAANILAGCASAKVKTLITSRGFVEKGKLDKLVSAIEESVLAQENARQCRPGSGVHRFRTHG